MDALAFLGQKGTPGPLYVVVGDEGFLKRQTLKAIRVRALGAEADEQSVSIHPGDTAIWADVFDDLDTVAFFEARRVVVIENADKFVTQYRSDLEAKVSALSKSATLVLDVKQWPANTRLARLVDNAATIVCKAPHTSRVPAWCGEWAKSEYGKELPSQAAALLVELIGPEMGLLDQEIAKLATYVADRPRIELADVDCLVGHSRTQDTWKIFNAIAAGNFKDSLTILSRLFEQGEDAFRILGAFSMQLRRLAQAYRLTDQGMNVGAALQQVGVPPFGLRDAEAQMRHLGRRRLDRIYDWLLEMQMGLRGGSPLPERTQFERLLVQLARPR